MVKATVVCDASFYRDKFTSQVHAGWAAWVRVDGVDGPIQGYGTITKGLCRDTSDSEFYAALNGIWIAARYGAKSVLVRSDCMAVIDATTGRLKAQWLVDIWRDALARPDMQGVSVTARHVKAHGKINSAATYVNDWCDTKAKKAQRLSRKGIPCRWITPST